MIGAGYASGQEIAAFFGWSPSLFVPLFCGVLMFAFTVVLLLVGNRLHTDSLAAVNRAVFGKAHRVVDAVMLFNALIVLSAMLAGMDGAVTELTGFAFPYGVLSGMLALLILRRGNRGLLAANVAVVPFIIVVLVVTCVTSPLTLGAFRWSSVPACFAYVSMNLLLSAGVFVRQSGMTTKQIFASGAIGAALIAGVMSLICCALPAASSVELPMLSLARDSNLAYLLFALCLAVSIFTTLLSAMSTLQSQAAARGNGTTGMLVGLMLAAAVSSLGFRKVVDFCYPIIGVLGFLYLLRAAVFLLPADFLCQCRERIHPARQKAKRHRRRHHEVGLEHLPAVDDEIAEPRARDEVFAHDRAHPRQTDVDLDDGKEGGKSGRQYGVT